MNLLTKYLYLLCVIWLLALLSGCSVISPEKRKENAELLATTHGWRQMTLPADLFTLTAFVPQNIHTTDLLTIYIEGDGLAWISPSRPSSDPSPLHPLGLELALNHSRGAAAYLARPCQYTNDSQKQHCAVTFWTDRRFAPEVVRAMNLAISQLKQLFGARMVELVGYSGGGAIAALTAAQRRDVIRLVTVAGNLDHQAWTSLHRAAPLKGSLNPADCWENLADIPQLHFVGGVDTNIPYAIARSYQARFPDNAQPEIRIVKDFDHICCWAENWPNLFP